MIEGLFIVLEGVDGSGTTTQCRILSSALREKGLPVHVTREPSDGPFGTQIRQILGGRIVVPGMSGGRPSAWNTMALLFAADRLDHLEATIHPNLMDGVTVISDRYDHSSIAYQSVTSDAGEESVAWVKELNRYARRPDLTIVLDVDGEVAARRRDERALAAEIYEEDDLQARLAEFYKGIDSYFEGDRIVHVDGNRSVDEVAADVLLEVKKLRGEA